MTIKLLHNTPLWVCSTAIRKCWASEDKSDTPIREEGLLEPMCGIKDRNLIDRVGNKNKHSSVLRHLNYTFDISEISTKTLLAFTRHKAGVDFSVQSTRYTTKKRKNGISYTKTSNESINQSMDIIGSIIQGHIEAGHSNDDISMLLPQAYQYSCIVTMNAQAIQHFLTLRTKPDAHYDIRSLAMEMYSNLPDEHKYLFKGSIYEDKK